MADLKFNIVYDRKHTTDAGKPGLLEIRFTMSGKQKYFSTGIKLTADQWNSRKKTIVRHPEAKELNLRLTTFTTKANNITAQVLNDTSLDINKAVAMFRGETAKEIDFPTYCEQRTLKRRVAESTKERYRTFTRFLRSWGKIHTFSDITVAKVSAMDEYLHARGIGLATIYNYHKYLKLFIADAVIDGFVSESPYRKLPFKIARGDKQYVDCLTIEQFEAIRSLNVSTPHIARARDPFLFQCLYNLSYF